MKHFEDPRFQALAKPLATGVVLTFVLGCSLYQLLFHSFFRGVMLVIPVMCVLLLLAGLWTVCGTELWTQLHGPSRKKPQPNLDELTHAAHLDQLEPEAPVPQPVPVPAAEPVQPVQQDAWQPSVGKQAPAAQAEATAPPSEMDEKVRKAQAESQKHLEQQARKREAEQARWNAKGQKYVEDAKQLQEKRLQEREQPTNWHPSKTTKR